MRFSKVHLSFIILTFLFNSDIYSQSRTIYGSVRDARSGEVISGATITANGILGAVTSNKYGFYSIQVSATSDTIFLSSVGYQTITSLISKASAGRLDVALVPLPQFLEEVIVQNRTGRVLDPEMSSHTIKIEAIKHIPAIAGEPDVLKSIQLLPGVNVVNEGTSNLNVRGGSFDQNLVLLDEAPVFNPSHALGFFSTFNADALRKVTFYKGVFPAQYGGRLSSVVDIDMKEGNNKELQFDGGIGLLASRFTVQGPIKADKSSFIVSGRVSYVGEVLDGLGSVISKSFVPKNNINFFDINAKANFQVGKSDKLYISSYTGGDKFYSYPLDETNKLRWGNTTATFRWNHQYTSSLFSNISLIFSNYRYSYNSLIDAKRFIWDSQINLGGMKADYDWFVSNSHTIKVGFQGFFNFFQPGAIRQSDSFSVIRSFNLQEKRSSELSLYLSDQWKISDKIAADIGLRSTRFNNIGPGTVFRYSPDFSQVIDSLKYKSGESINMYVSFEPRLSARYLISNESSLKASYSQTTQFLHLISNSTVGLPTDVWLPADKYIRPQDASQFALGYTRYLSDKKIELSVEAYYKQFRHTVDFKDNANLFLNPNLETQLLSGIGRSYGLELFGEKRSGRLTGWISYTWSNTQLKIVKINNGKWYAAKYDIRHNFTVTANYEKNSWWSFSSTFRLTSGPHITVPSGDYTYLGGSFNFYSDRNGYTLPSYNRLDISAVHRSKPYGQAKIKKEWVFSIFNAYNKYNIFSLFIKPDKTNLDEVRAFKFYLYGVVPSVTLNFKF